MAPLPKRKHSKKRSGKRESVKKLKDLANLVKCKNCGKMKLSHRVCKYCGK